MNRSEVMAIIKEAAERHGFLFSDDGNSVQIKDGKDWLKSWVGFSVYENPVFDAGAFNPETKWYRMRFDVVVKSYVTRTGGDGIYDLMMCSFAARNAASLLDELGRKELCYYKEGTANG